jgi:hypothetical protein
MLKLINNRVVKKNSFILFSAYYKKQSKAKGKLINVVYLAKDNF